MNPEFIAALSDDLAALIRAHDRELDAAALKALQAVNFPLGLALKSADFTEEAERKALLGAISAQSEQALDGLAADYAALYLTHALGISPYESVWRDEEGLTCQAPLFAVRAHFAEAGLQRAPGETRHEDHLVLELLFLAHVLQRPAPNWPHLARFIDQHLGLWLPDFAKQARARASHPFYAHLAIVTAGWVSAFRRLLEAP